MREAKQKLKCWDGLLVHLRENCIYLTKWNDKRWENIKYLWCERQQNTSAWGWVTFTYWIIESELSRDTNWFQFALKCLCELRILIPIIQSTKLPLQKTRIIWIISFYYKFIRIIGTLGKNDISQDGCKNEPALFILLSFHLIHKIEPFYRHKRLKVGENHIMK